MYDRSDIKEQREMKVLVRRLCVVIYVEKKIIISRISNPEGIKMCE